MIGDAEVGQPNSFYIHNLRNQPLSLLRRHREKFAKNAKFPLAESAGSCKILCSAEYSATVSLLRSFCYGHFETRGTGLAKPD